MQKAFGFAGELLVPRTSIYDNDLSHFHDSDAEGDWSDAFVTASAFNRFEPGSKAGHFDAQRVFSSRSCDREFSTLICPSHNFAEVWPDELYGCTWNQGSGLVADHPGDERRLC